MNITEAIKTCYSKYADFNGRASQSEYWYFVLYYFGAEIILSFIWRPFLVLFILGSIVPLVAAGSRRLHDTNQTGWLQLLYLVPLIGWLIMIVMMAQAPKEPNRYGPGTAANDPSASGPVA